MLFCLQIYVLYITFTNFFQKKDIYIMQYTDLQSFFVERFIELLHKNTLDSYRVRTHNAYTLLKELQELLIDWGNNQIKQFETRNSNKRR